MPEPDDENELVMIDFPGVVYEESSDDFLIQISSSGIFTIQNDGSAPEDAPPPETN